MPCDQSNATGTAVWSEFRAEPTTCENCGARVWVRVRLGRGYPSQWDPWRCVPCARKARGARLPAELDAVR